MIKKKYYICDMKIVKTIYLLLVYLVARAIKLPMFWVSISNFKRWSKIEEYISRDKKIFWLTVIFASIFLLFNFLTTLIVILIYYILGAIILIKYDENKQG